MREKLVDVKAQRDEYRKRLNLADSLMCSLARGELPDAEDQATMPDGTVYRIRVYGLERAHGGTVLISFWNIGYGNRETFDAQYWEDALIQARATATSSPESWAYRDAFERLDGKIRKLRQKVSHG